MATSHGEVLLAMLQKRLPEGVSRNKKQSSGLFSRRTPEHACEGREADGCNIGQCLTAGWAQRRWFWALYGANTPGEVLLEMLQKRLPEGAVRRCPAALARLDSGRGEVAVQGLNSQIRVGTRATFAS